MDKVFKLNNGQEVISIKDYEKRVANKESAFKKVLNRITTAVTSRSSLLQYLGKSFSGERDLYTILGYPTTIAYERYDARYSRQELAKACIDRPVNSSWRKKPTISDNDDPEVESTFEEAIKELLGRIRVYNYMARADKLACIGQYSIILLGFGDETSLDKEVIPSENNQLKYMSVFSEANAGIVEWEDDATNERFGLPTMYSIKVYLKNGGQSRELRVHYTRVVHVLHEALESDIYGTPQLQAIYNRLQDIETISGGSAEMYWKGARPGYVMEVDDDFTFDADAKSGLDDELDEWDHELRRFIRLQGVKVKPLESQLSSPKEYLEALIDLVAAGVNIPKRILMGSERGELASGQDANNWNERMEIRREDYLEPVIVRPFLDRLIEVKALPEPEENNYTIEWPEFEIPGEESIVKNAELASKALAAYADSPGASMIIPPEEFLQRFLGYSKEEAKNILEEFRQKMEEEDEDIDAGMEEEEDFIEDDE